MIYVQVECYSGYKGEERPVRFQIGERLVQVESIQDQWYSPGLSYFRVVGQDGILYVLRHDLAQDVWNLEVQRRES